MDARHLKYHDFVKVLEKKTTNGLDLTFKCLSLMLKKTIIVICEDYLWLSHGIDFHDFDLFFVMNQGGEIGAAKPRTGDVIHCELLNILMENDEENTYKQSQFFDHTLLNRSDVKKSELVDVLEDGIGTEDSLSISTNKTTPMNTNGSEIGTDHTIDPNENSAVVVVPECEDRTIPMNTDGTEISTDRTIDPNDTSAVGGVPECENKSEESFDKPKTTLEPDTEKQGINADPSPDITSVSVNLLKSTNDVIDAKDQMDSVHPVRAAANETINTSQLESTINITSQDSSFKETVTEGNTTSTSVCSIAGNYRK